MNFNRLLKVPRSTRTIHLVINIPETPAHSVAAPSAEDLPQGRPWNRILAASKVAGPIIASAAAIIISIFSLLEQNQVYVAMATASQRQEAERVSFVQEPSTNPRSSTPVLLENLGTLPVDTVSLYVVVETYNKLAENFYDWNLPLLDIPACSSATINVSPAAISAAHLPASASTDRIAIYVNTLDFRDSNDLYWQYTGYNDNDGQLQQIASPSGSGLIYSGTIKPSYKSASGCS
jgi:hypothetical protein